MTAFTLEGSGWAHEVVVGDLSRARARIDRLTGGNPVPLVTDSTVLALHGERAAQVLRFEPIVVPCGESGKSWECLGQVLACLADAGLTRDRPLFALGGGSIGDLAGLAAALFKRGCPVVHIPTTLMSQVDSAIGGKTAIDFAGAKNLVGTFHVPALVACDPAFLDTLDRRQIRSGYAEVVKYGLIDDPDFFAWCESQGQMLLDGDSQARLHAIGHCLRAKARLIGDDLHDLSGRRALLNLGHSFAHAIEAKAGLGEILHGEAVAVGLVLAVRLSNALGLCPAETCERLCAHLQSVGLPTRLGQVGLEGRGPELLDPILRDKKADKRGPALILVRGIGEAFVARDTPVDRLAGFLAGSGL